MEIVCMLDVYCLVCLDYVHFTWTHYGEGVRRQLISICGPQNSRASEARTNRMELREAHTPPTESLWNDCFCRLQSPQPSSFNMATRSCGLDTHSASERGCDVGVEGETLYLSVVCVWRKLSHFAALFYWWPILGGKDPLARFSIKTDNYTRWSSLYVGFKQSQIWSCVRRLMRELCCRWFRD